MDEDILLVLVLNKIELLDDLLMAWNDEDIQAATILDSIGMAKHLSETEDMRIISTLRPFLLSDHSENKIIFTILDREDVHKARRVVRKVVGDLSDANTGIMFGIPLMFTEGIRY